MKYLIFLSLFLTAIFAPALSFSACWQSEEIAKIEGFSELEEEVILSFKDALDCLPVEGAAITLAGQTFETDSKGYLILPLEAFEEIEDDEVLIKAEKKGYITLESPVRVRIGTLLDKRFLMSKDLPVESARFVLQWGDEPQDLDLHLLSSDFHISFRHKKYIPQKARLDRDSLRGYGPETITLQKVNNKQKYHVFVDNFSVGEDINNEATVTVYINNKLDRVVRLPDTPMSAVKILEIENGHVSYVNKPVRKVKQ